MKIKTIIASVVILCLPLTIGVSVNKYLKDQASQKQMLNELKSSNSELERTNLELKKQIEKLNVDLQAKAEAKAKLAAASLSLPATASVPANCELYRSLVSGYDWPVDQAMNVMRLESGCNPNRISSTQDHGLFQLHLEPVYDPQANIARAYQKYVRARVGYRNWSAWYSVCTPSATPKYQGYQCSS